MSRSLDELHPIVKQKAEKMISEAASQGIEILVTATYRSKEEQDALYAKGRTAPGNIVTNASYPYSLHNHGVAFDVVPIKDGKAVWNDYGLWDQIGVIGKSVGLEWGGDWTSFPDRPHFQYTAGLSIYDFINGETLPDMPTTTITPTRILSTTISDWAKDAWEKATMQNIVTSSTMPQDSVNKEELMVFLDRAGILHTLPDTGSPSAYNPSVSSWAVDAWDKANRKAIIGEDTQPQDDVSKEELMVFFDRAGIV